MESETKRAEAGRTVRCASCMALNGRSESFCEECGAPISATATLVPTEVIRAEGFMLRKAMEGRPRFIVLLGVWILHLPVLIIGLGSAIYIIINWRGLSAFVFFWVLIGLSLMAFIILYRITKNYLIIPKKE